MALSPIDLGSAPDAGDGDTALAAFTKIKNALAEIYGWGGDGSTLGSLLSAANAALTGNTTAENVAVSVSFVLKDGVTLTFEGATSDAYETTLTVTDPTADRTITLPNQSGTVLLTGKHALAIGAAAFEPADTNGPERSTLVGGSNGITLPALLFDPDTAETAYFLLPAAKSLALGTAPAVQLRCARSGGSSGDVIWEVAIQGIDAGDSLDPSLSFTELSAVTLTSDQTRYVTSEATVSIAGSPSAECDLLIAVRRKAGDTAGDDFTGDAYFLNLYVKPTISAPSDD